MSEKKVLKVVVEARDTTVFLDSETSRKLGILAKANERSKAAQVRFWVNKEYESLILADTLNAGAVRIDSPEK
jgi:hypothetical protein